MSNNVSKATRDHEEIRHWAEAHHGGPARVRGTGSDQDPGLLRLDFPGGAGSDKLEHIPWDTWFDKFDKNHLEFLYQEKKKSGEDSTFFKLIHKK